MWKILILCTMITSLAADAKVSYENYKVFSIVPKTQLQLELLQKLRDVIDFSYWKGPSWIGKKVLIMVPPHKLWMFYETMNNSNMVYKIKITNVQKLIDDTMPQNQSQSFDFKSYHTLDTIYANLHQLAKQYPDKARVIVAGRTFEGRLIKGVWIFNEEKPGIFIEGGIHAMGWISPATAMYILHQLLSSKDPNVRYIADNHNWFIFPIINPDGYVYSFTHDRLWRKTRQPSDLVRCIGSDPNRNWNIQWGTNGINSNPCSEIYPGNVPFSELETRAINRYLNSIHPLFYAYISFHSFGQRLLFPYAYTKKCFFHEDVLHRVGWIAINALKRRYQTQYVTGCMGKINGLMSGLSTDYVANVLRKPIVCTYELRDKGQYGFLLPPEQIIPTGEETLDSLMALFNATLYQLTIKPLNN